MNLETPVFLGGSKKSALIRLLKDILRLRWTFVLVRSYAEPSSESVFVSIYPTSRLTHA